MFLGLRTVIYAAPDLEQTKTWYAAALNIQPYFDEPFYVGFNVGGYELGLDPDAVFADGSTVTYWGVTNIETAFAHFISQGATEHGPITDVGDGVKTATLRDPFGNVIGLIENPYFNAG